MIAGFKGYVDGGIGQFFRGPDCGIINGHHLGMGAACFGVKALANDLTIFYHHGTHTGIGRGISFAPGCKRQGPCHIFRISHRC